MSAGEEANSGQRRAGLSKALGGQLGDWDYCNSGDCLRGEGDCDLDSHCLGELVCGRGKGARFGLSPHLDVCWPAHCEDGVQNVDETGLDLGGGCDACSGSAPGDYDHCSAACPCPLGEGDCDSDADCGPGLICGVKNGPRFGLPLGMDLCWPPHCEDGRLSGDERGVDLGGSCDAGCDPGILGSYDYCSAACPCAAGQGDCDLDSHCEPSLVCASDEGLRYGLSSDIDICRPAGCYSTLWGYCADDCPCLEGEGDCDGDSHCSPGLLCGSQNGADYGREPSLDLCVPPPDQVHFAVIGDYGEAGNAAALVAALIESVGVDFIVTTGDNNYDDGLAERIDDNIGQYFSAYIGGYQGSYGLGALHNRFWPALGNADLDTDLGQPYLDYFNLPGNERYYEVRLGLIHLFVLNSDPREPDGVDLGSAQADWLQSALGASDACLRIVVLHHPPYTSAARSGGGSDWMRWPFAAWGADFILAGHEHLYERLEVEGIPLLISGLGGKSRHLFGEPIPESQARHRDSYGALFIQASAATVHFEFRDISQELIDSYSVRGCR